MSFTPKTPAGRAILSVFFLFCLGSMWGMSPTFQKVATEGGIAPPSYMLWLGIGGSLFLLVICLIRRTLPPLGPRYLVYYGLSGSVNFGLPLLVQAIVVEHVPISAYVLILTLSPLMTYVIATAIGAEKAAARRLFGVCLGFVGTLLILVPRTSLPSPDMIPWALLGILTPILYATSNVYIGHARPKGVDSLGLALGMTVAMMLSMAPIAFIHGDIYVPEWPLRLADAGVIGHILTTGLGTLILFELMRLAGSVYMSQVSYLMTLVGMISGVLLFDEVPSPWIWAASAVVIAGLALVTWPKRAVPPPVVSAAPG